MDASNNAQVPAPSDSKPSESQKYIRTFSGDMDTVKKGGQPDLSPFTPKRPATAKSGTQAPAAVPAQTPAFTAPPPPPPPPPKPSEPERASAEPSLVVGRDFIPESVAPHEPPPPQKEPEEIVIESDTSPRLSPRALPQMESLVFDPKKDLKENAGKKSGEEISLAPLSVSENEIPPEVVPEQQTPRVSEETLEAPVHVSVPQTAAFEPRHMPAEPFQPAAPRKEPAANDALSPIETYTLDFSDRMKKQQASTATVLAAEADAQKPSPAIQPKPARRKAANAVFVVLAIVLLSAGGFGVYYAYKRHQEQGTLPLVLAPAVSAPIYVDDRVEVSGTGNTLAAAIEQSLANPLGADKIRELYLPLGTASTTVFQSLELPAPSILLRNIVPGNSMAGIVQANGTKSVFFILSVSSYSDTFAGMLSWEPTLPNDLAIFNTQNETASSTNANASTTPGIAQSEPVGTFSDQTVDNHDARVFTDGSGNQSVVYGYWNPSTLIIAHDSQAFTDIIQRLATSNTH